MIDLIYNLTNLVSDLEDSKPYFAAGSLTLAVGALVGPWESTRIIGLTALAGITCQAEATYIIHQKEKSTSPKPSFEWMQTICQALPVGAIAGTILGTLARIPCAKLPLKVTAEQLAPYLTLSTALILLVSHTRGQLSSGELKGNRKQRCWEYHNTFMKSTTQMFLAGTPLLSMAIVAARAGVINLGSPFKLLTTRSL